MSLQHRCFLVNIAEFLRSPFLKNIYKQLLSDVISTQSAIKQSAIWLLHNLFF